MKHKPFDYVSSVSHTKEYLMTDPEAESGYNAFLTNRAFSYYCETIMFADEMNQCPHLPVKNQYDYYFHGLPKKKRFAKWHKKEDVETVQCLSEYFECGLERSRQIINILTPEQVAEIVQRMDKGGASGE